MSVIFLDLPQALLDLLQLILAGLIDIGQLILAGLIDLGQLVLPGLTDLGQLAAASPVPLGVFVVAGLIGYGSSRWKRAVLKRLASGAKIRPFTPDSRVSAPAPEWSEGVAPGAPPEPPDWREGSPSTHGVRGGASDGVPGPGTIRPASVVASPTSSASPSAPAGVVRSERLPPVEAPPPPKAPPSVPPPKALGFGWKVTVLFAVYVSILLYISRFVFSLLAFAVGWVGEFLFWPQLWPGATPAPPAVVADYIFIMYLSLFLAFASAHALVRPAPLKPGQRRAATVTFAAWLGFVVLLDTLVQTFHVDPFTSSLTIVVRALMGGFFLAIFQFTTLVVPLPLLVERWFPRRKGEIALLVAAAITSILGAVLILYVAWTYLGLGRSLLPFAVLLLMPIYAYMLWILIGRALYSSETRANPVPPLSVYHPNVSLVIPAYNEAKHIAGAVRNADAAAGLYPGKVEIIVGNDGSRDATSAIAHAEIANLKHAKGRVLDLPHGGKSSALNGMLKAAKGEILLRADADCVIDPKVGFAPMISHFANRNVGGVQGVILPLQSEGWIRKMRLLEICFNHLFLRPAQMAYGAAQVVDGAFCAFRRSDMLRVGGWADWNGEDTEITLRLQRLGYRMRFEPRALLREDVPQTFEGLKKQRVRWSRGGVFAHLRHYGSVFSEAPEFGGLALLVWIAMYMRGGMRHLVYLYAALATLILGLPTIFHLAAIVVLLLVPRAAAFLYYLGKLGASRRIPWITIWPVVGALKQYFTMEAFGTMLPGAIPEFSE